MAAFLNFAGGPGSVSNEEELQQAAAEAAATMEDAVTDAAQNAVDNFTNKEVLDSFADTSALDETLSQPSQAFDNPAAEQPSTRNRINDALEEKNPSSTQPKNEPTPQNKSATTEEQQGEQGEPTEQPPYQPFDQSPPENELPEDTTKQPNNDIDETQPPETQPDQSPPDSESIQQQVQTLQTQAAALQQEERQTIQQLNQAKNRLDKDERVSGLRKQISQLKFSLKLVNLAFYGIMIIVIFSIITIIPIIILILTGGAGFLFAMAGRLRFQKARLKSKITRLQDELSARIAQLQQEYGIPQLTAQLGQTQQKIAGISQRLNQLRSA